MRKLLITAVLSLIPACGCSDCWEMARRVEVWKAQNFFTPREPVAISSTNPCGVPAAPTAGCSCQQGAAAAAVVSSPAVMPGPDAEMPGAVSAGYPAGSDEPVSTEEFNGVLKQP